MIFLKDNKAFECSLEDYHKATNAGENPVLMPLKKINEKHKDLFEINIQERHDIEVKSACASTSNEQKITHLKYPKNPMLLADEQQLLEQIFIDGIDISVPEIEGRYSVLTGLSNEESKTKVAYELAKLRGLKLVTITEADGGKLYNLNLMENNNETRI